MVFVLPACWSGALILAQQQGTAAPSTSNSNEEREEHEEREVDERNAAHRRATPPPPPRVRELIARHLPIPAPATVAAGSVVHLRTPFALSVKRLL